MTKPHFAITLGDPLGIGPEIVKKALSNRKIRSLASWEIFGEEGFPLTWNQISKLSDKKRNDELRAAGLLSWQALNLAIAAVKKEKWNGIITAPVSKTHLKMAGFPFPGQTEFLANTFKIKKFQMMLVGGGLRVVLVTIHEPLKNIFSKITQQKIKETILATHHELKSKFGIKNPRIAVCGLNPHAGENGMLGDEEIKIISPAIRSIVKKGIQVTGPVAPDTVFYRAMKGEFDAVVCQYHDQGLIPLKTLAFDSGVNTTLGLPIIRTSPDHGCAFDIAGKNIANPQSMMEAMKLAVEMV